MCPSAEFSGIIIWDNPSIPEDFHRGIVLTLEQYNIQCICLHEAQISIVSLTTLFI